MNMMNRTWLCIVKHCIAVFTKCVLSFVSIFFDNNGCILSYFQMTQIFTAKQVAQ